MSRPTITDLCDRHTDLVRVAAPVFQDYGKRPSFAGPISTLKVFEDNALVRATLEQPGRGHVLVIDGGGSMRCALLGGNLAALAERSGWDGVVIHGCVRDLAELAQVDVGIRALAAHPMKSVKRGSGDRDVPVTFAGITFVPGERLYADRDGIIVASQTLE